METIAQESADLVVAFTLSAPLSNKSSERAHPVSGPIGFRRATPCINQLQVWWRSSRKSMHTLQTLTHRPIFHGLPVLSDPRAIKAIFAVLVGANEKNACQRDPAGRTARRTG